jgi:hypothetical protein
MGHVDAAVRGHRGPRDAADDATMVVLRFRDAGEGVREGAEAARA